MIANEGRMPYASVLKIFILSFAPILYLLLIGFTGKLILVHVLYRAGVLVKSVYKHRF